MSVWRQEWSKADEARLKELAGKPGITVAMLAEQFKRSREAMRVKLYNLGIRLPHPPQWSEERTQQVVKLWNDGLSAGQIAQRIGGLSRNAVIGKLHRLGLTRSATGTSTTGRTNRKPRPPKSKRRIVKPNPLLELAKLPLPEEPPDEIARTTILDREKDQCAWVIGEPREMKCCGAPVVPGLPSPWCAEHARRGYDLPTVSRRPFVLPDMQQALARKKARQAGELEEAA